MSRILAADSFNRSGRALFHYSHYALGAFVPLACFAPDNSVLQTVADWGITAALPVHSQISVNAVVSDYVPKPVRGAARVATLFGTATMFLGLAKLNATGPGLTRTVRQLWHKEPPLSTQSTAV
ncbi:unnamed protein product [Pedinophyceae sp. YPF-701]|nr:unnamed protein product [Pedinophyceae sp. YPF-701]